MSADGIISLVALRPFADCDDYSLRGVVVTADTFNSAPVEIHGLDDMRRLVLTRREARKLARALRDAARVSRDYERAKVGAPN